MQVELEELQPKLVVASEENIKMMKVRCIHVSINQFISRLPKSVNPMAKRYDIVSLFVKHLRFGCQATLHRFITLQLLFKYLFLRQAENFLKF